MAVIALVGRKEGCCYNLLNTFHHLFFIIPVCASLILYCFYPLPYLVWCSPLDYLPTLLFLRRLPHLDAPVMITSSVSNVNVSVQLGDTTPFALGFLSANGGTCGAC